MGLDLITTLFRIRQRRARLSQTAWNRQTPNGAARTTETDQKAARHRRIIPERTWLYRPARQLRTEYTEQTHNRQRTPVGDLVTCCGGLRNAKGNAGDE